MITINAYGYNVTGNDKIISAIMDMMNDNEITINWNNFKNNDIFWNGDEKYYVEIDHNKKTVSLYIYPVLFDRKEIEIMLLAYIDHRKILQEFDEEMDDREAENDAEYQFHKACCETSEMWMKAIGISPKCEFITERI